MLGLVHQAGWNILFPLLGPPGPTDDASLLVLVVIIGLELLGLVNFDNRNG